VPKTVDIKKERKNFTTLTNADIKAFKEIVGTENVVSDLDDVQPFVMDFTKKYVGVGSVVILPTTTEQVSRCLKYCNDRVIAVVP
jgi:FAD/FMN-containing dehydrogenase